MSITTETQLETLAILVIETKVLVELEKTNLYNSRYLRETATHCHDIPLITGDISVFFWTSEISPSELDTLIGVLETLDKKVSWESFGAAITNAHTFKEYSYDSRTFGNPDKFNIISSFNYKVTF